LTETQWLYDLVRVVDGVSRDLDVRHRVPNIAEWVAQIQQDERERCAVTCDKIEAKWREQAERHDLMIDIGRRDGAGFCGVAIRELGVGD
jgi:hypothetical protein